MAENRVGSLTAPSPSLTAPLTRATHPGGGMTHSPAVLIRVLQHFYSLHIRPDPQNTGPVESGLAFSRCFQHLRYCHAHLGLQNTGGLN